MQILMSNGLNGKEARITVCEIFSPPRITAAAKRLPHLDILPGFALGLATTDGKGEVWDYDLAAKRQQAREPIDKEKPYMIVGSPTCTAYSIMQNLNESRRDPKTVRKLITRSRVHLHFFFI